MSSRKKPPAGKQRNADADANEAGSYLTGDVMDEYAKDETGAEGARHHPPGKKVTHPPTPSWSVWWQKFRINKKGHQGPRWQTSTPADACTPGCCFTPAQPCTALCQTPSDACTSACIIEPDPAPAARMLVVSPSDPCTPACATKGEAVEFCTPGCNTEGSTDACTSGCRE